MVLLQFCKKYIYKKALLQTGAYALNDSKYECILLMKNATSFALLINYMQHCKKLELHSVANHIIVVKFCIYSKTMLFPYSKKPFDYEFVSDYLFIQTSNKSTVTKSYYHKILIAFVNKYNQEVHSCCKKMVIYCEKHYELKMDLFYTLSESELKKIFIELEKKNNWQRLMYLLLLHTGIRISEMLNLKKIDFRWTQELCLIEIKGKGGFFRFVPIKSANIKSLFIELTKDKDLDTYIFTDKKGIKLSRQYIYKTIKNFLSELGIFKIQNGPHLFRHTFASMLYEKSKDLILVQETLGHMDISSTQRYIHLNKVNLIKMAEALDLWEEEKSPINNMFLGDLSKK